MSQSNALSCISPIDGRYALKTSPLAPYFSEAALMKYRCIVELKYLKYLAAELRLPELNGLPIAEIDVLLDKVSNNMVQVASEIKAIERTTNHDVKAVEYWLRDQLSKGGCAPYIEFIHFGLTSQDINNTAVPLSIKDGLAEVIYPALLEVHQHIADLSKKAGATPMLARTHGQPASPTRLDKEIDVFYARMTAQLQMLYAVPHHGKFGGATGNFNAHTVAYPDIDWHDAGDQFMKEYLGLQRSAPTTQIEHYDMIAAQCHAIMRVNTILIDFCRDVWTYISIEYFLQKHVAHEVGSSAMPHKVNPIDFENAEGNLGIANALFDHLASKLPISRLQRDLTDSTVLRNVGVPLAHSLIAYKSILKGIGKLEVNKVKIQADLDDHWAVLAEAIQTVLRKEGVEHPYEQLKQLTRGQQPLDAVTIARFVDGLDIPTSTKTRLKSLTPADYVGQYR